MLATFPLAGSIAGVAGAASPDTRLAKLAWIGARLPGAGPSEREVRHWLDRLGAGETLPSVLHGVRATARRDFAVERVVTAGGLRLARAEASLAKACHAYVTGGAAGA